MGLELQAHWAKYTCVIMCGYIETAIIELLRQYVEEKRCPKPVTSYITYQLKFFQNASVDKIIALVASFDKGWETSLSTFIDDERRAAINSVVGNRHRIAHGLDVTVTVAQLARWYPKVTEVITHIKGLCTT